MEVRGAWLTQGTSNWHSEGSLHIQRVSGDRSTVREYHLHQSQRLYTHMKIDISEPQEEKIKEGKRGINAPHILMGASSSRSTGCEANMSLDLMHSHRISFSVRVTWRPGREPRTARSCSIIVSTSASTSMAY